MQHLNERVVMNLGFDSITRQKFWNDDGLIGSIENIKEHKRENGKIITGLFEHKDNPKILLFVPEGKDVFSLGILGKSGIRKSISIQLDDMDVDEDFIYETMKNYVEKHR